MTPLEVSVKRVSYRKSKLASAMQKTVDKGRRFSACITFTPKMLSPNRSPAQWVRFGKEEQRNEREMTFDAKHKKSSQAICSLRRRGGEEGIRLHFSQRTPYLKKKPCRAKNKCVHRCAHRFTHMPPACADMIRIPLLCFAKRKTPSTGRDFRPQTKLAKFASKERKDHGIRFCRSSVTAKHHEASQASSQAAAIWPRPESCCPADRFGSVETWNGRRGGYGNEGVEREERNGGSEGRGVIAAAHVQDVLPVRK